MSEEENLETQDLGEETEVSEQTEEVVEQQTPKEYDYKVDGVEGKIEEAKLKKFLDIPEDQELPENLARFAINAYQKDVAASNRMNTAAKIQAQVRDLVSRATQDTEGFLSALGVDFETLALLKVKEILELQKMDPRERDYLLMQKEREAWENAKMQEEQRRLEAMQEEEAIREGQRLSEQAQKVSNQLGMPYNNVVRNMFRYALEEGVKAGKLLEPEDVAPWVKGEWEKFLSESAKAMPPELLAKTFGSDVLGKIKQASASQLKDPLRQNAPVPPQQSTQETQKPRRANEVWREIQEKYGI